MNNGKTHYEGCWNSPGHAECLASAMRSEAQNNQMIDSAYLEAGLLLIRGADCLEDCRFNYLSHLRDCSAAHREKDERIAELEAELYERRGKTNHRRTNK